MLLGLDGLCIGNGILTVETPRAGGGARRSGRPEQGRRRGRGGDASGGARPPLCAVGPGLPEGSFRVAGDFGDDAE